MNIPVFDLHCDTSLALLGKDGNQAGNLRKNDLHIDLERGSALAGYCQCFSCFTTTEMTDWYKTSPVVMFERELATLQREFDKNADKIAMVYSPEEIEENRKRGIISAVLSIEGTAGIDYNPELLEDLYLIGFRFTNLTWNEANPLSGSHLTGEGLSDLGKAYVREAQRLGMLVDVSHISDKGFWDIMEMTSAPVVATHSSSRALCGHSRNLTDDMFRAIAATDGVAGINLYSNFIGENPDLDMACDHVFHFLELDPSGRHIALGSDMDGCDSLVAGMDGICGYPRFAQRLLERGVDKAILENIFWNNALGVMRRAVCKHQK